VAEVVVEAVVEVVVEAVVEVVVEAVVEVVVEAAVEAAVEAVVEAAVELNGPVKDKFLIRKQRRTLFAILRPVILPQTLLQSLML
jgi:hypothetical protein